MDLITLQEYKTAKNLSGDPKNDDRISFLITSVSNLIKAYIKMGTGSAGEVVTEVITSDYETNQIFLEKYPIQSIVSVSESSPRYTTDSTIHVPLTGNIDYIIDLPNGVLTRIVSPGGFATWPLSPGVITVQYTTSAVWDTIATVPADLKLATIALVDYYKDEEYRQSKSVQGTTLVNTLAQGEDFPKHIQTILDRYL